MDNVGGGGGFEFTGGGGEEDVVEVEGGYYRLQLMTHFCRSRFNFNIHSDGWMDGLYQ